MAEPIHPSRTAVPFRLGSSSGQGWQVAPDRISMLRPEPAPRPASFAARPRAVELDLSRTALIAVDLQNDFLHGEGWFAQAGRQGQAPVDRIDAFAKACRSAGVPVVWLNWGLPGTAAHLPASTLYRGKREAGAVGYGERPAGRDGGTLQAGSWGAGLVDGLTRDPGDHEVHKQRFSGFPDTHLDSLLRRMGVSTLLFCGINTDRCVFETLTDAAALGYDCVLVSDLCATVSPPTIEAAIVWLVETLHGFVAESSDLLAALSSVPPAQEA